MQSRTFGSILPPFADQKLCIRSLDFGLIITVALVAQFILGFMHHRISKKTLNTPKFAPVHIWLGRLIIPCGIAEFPVTSLDEMEVSCGQERFDMALKQGFDGFLTSLEGGGQKA